MAETLVAPINYSTKIAVSKTVAEIVDLLARVGASRIATNFEDGRPNGISFALQTEAFGARVYELPCDVNAMHRKMVTLSRARKLPGISQREGQSREQAERVAWRVTRTWLASQLSLLETDMISVEQLLFPHMKVGSFESPTVYELASSRPDMLMIEG